MGVGGQDRVDDPDLTEIETVSQFSDPPLTLDEQHFDRLPGGGGRLQGAAEPNAGALRHRAALRVALDGGTDGDRRAGLDDGGADDVDGEDGADRSVSVGHAECGNCGAGLRAEMRDEPLLDDGACGPYGQR